MKDLVLQFLNCLFREDTEQTDVRHNTGVPVHLALGRSSSTPPPTSQTQQVAAVPEGGDREGHAVGKLSFNQSKPDRRVGQKRFSSSLVHSVTMPITTNSSKRQKSLLKPVSKPKDVVALTDRSSTTPTLQRSSKSASSKGGRSSSSPARKGDTTTTSSSNKSNTIRTDLLSKYGSSQGSSKAMGTQTSSFYKVDPETYVNIRCDAVTSENL